jgi:hypothetical protein
MQMGSKAVSAAPFAVVADGRQAVENTGLFKFHAAQHAIMRAFQESASTYIHHVKQYPRNSQHRHHCPR